MPDNPKINIKRQNFNMVLKERAYPDPGEDQRVIKATESFRSNKNVRLLFAPEAAAKLMETVAWGSGFSPNSVEQAGLLVGKYYQSTSPRNETFVWGEVKAVIPFDSGLVRSTHTSITITIEAWSKMLREYVPFNDEGCLMLGWYHTHLGNIPTRFSGIDTINQRTFFTGQYSFAVVLNPNLKKWSVVYGPDAKECCGDFFVTDEILDRLKGPQITIRNVGGDAEQRSDGTILHRTAAADNRSVSGNAFSLKKAIGLWLEKTGRWLISGDDFPYRNDMLTAPTDSTPSNRPRIHQRSAAPRITVKDTEKPKITIRSALDSEATMRVVKATVAVIDTDAPSDWKTQDSDGLQVIDLNVTQILETILSKNENSTSSLGSPINADVRLNEDLTLEFFLSEEGASEGNAVIRISNQPIDTAFTKRLVNHHIGEVIKQLEDGNGDGAMHLVYVGNTTERTELLLLRIERKVSNE